MSKRLLIVNADDFGLNEAANAGIIQSHQAGSVTSTTLMVNAPAGEAAARLAHRNPELGVGLHFNLTWGRPLSAPEQVPALLADDGTFVSRGLLGRRVVAGRVPAAQVALELQAQFERLRELGVQPTHIDSHQHVHGFGVVFDAIAGQCTSAGIPMRVPWAARDTATGITRRLRRSLLAALLARSTRRWRGRVRWNDGIGSVFDLGLDAQEFGDAHYLRILTRARGHAFELMVHPVVDAQAMQGYTQIGAVGEAEWRYLRTGSLRALAQAIGFRLGSYRDLVA